MAGELSGSVCKCYQETEGCLSQLIAPCLPYGAIARFGIGKQWLVQKVKMKVKVAQSRPTLCDPVDSLLQARILEWVAVRFSRGSSHPSG